VRVWLDDTRTPPDPGWTWVRTVEDAVDLLAAGGVTEISLDNDLGGFATEGRKVCDWMEENGVWPETVRVHTANIVASSYMCTVVERAGYVGVPGRPRWFRRIADQ